MFHRIVAGLLTLSVPVAASAHPGHGHPGHGLHYVTESQHILPLGLLVIGGLAVVLLVAARRSGSRR